MEIVAEWGEKGEKSRVWGGMGNQLQLERDKAIIRAQSKFQLMGAEDTRRVQGLAALPAAICIGDFGTEGAKKEGAIAWKLFWTLHHPQSVKGQTCLFLSAAGQQGNAGAGPFCSRHSTLLLWNCQIHIGQQIIKNLLEFYFNLSASDGKR